MKKLLSAVTSAVMSASLVTGAFTSSVSAAGSFAAAQPNVSMGGVLDVAANKTAGEDVVFDFGNYTADAGTKILVNVTVDTQGKPVSAMDVRFAVDSPLKITMIDKESPAFSTSVMTNLNNLGANFKALDAKGEPTTPTSDPVFTLQVEIPSTTPSGDYNIGFGSKKEVHKSNDGSQYTVGSKNGVISVKGSGSSSEQTPSTPASTAPTSTPSTPSNTTPSAGGQSSSSTSGEVVFDFQNYTAKAGDKFLANVLVDTQGKAVSAMDVKFKVDSPLKITAIDKESAAFGTTMMTNMAILGANFKSLDSNGDPMVPESGEPVFTLQIEVPSTTADGVYYVGFGDKKEVHKSNDGSQYTVGSKNGAITVGNPSSGGSTPSGSTPSSSTPSSSTPSSSTPTAPSKTGEVMFDFQNYTAKAGDKFLANVLVDTQGKAVSAMDVKFKIDSPLKITAIDKESAAFGTTMMTNMAILGANFKSLDSNGDPLVPESGEAVFTLQIEVPSTTADGVYYVTFGDKYEVHKSNDGSQYTVGYKNGAITVGNPSSGGSTPSSSTPSSSDPTTPTTPTAPSKTGEVMFDFQNYTAKAGDKFLANVLVDTQGKAVSAMDVKFKIDSPLKITAIDKESAAFGTTMMTNMAILGANFKSLDSNGDPLVPESGEAVFTLQIEVPSTTADGVYYVTFGDKYEVHKSNDGSQYTVGYKNGAITVGNPSSGGTTTPATPAAAGEAVFDFGNYETEAGKDILVNVKVDTAGDKVSAMDVVFKIDSPLEITAIDKESPAFGGASVMTNIEVLGANFKALDNKGEPLVPTSDNVFTIKVNVPAGTAAGTYNIGFGNKKEVHKDNRNTQYTVSSKNGVITVVPSGAATTDPSTPAQSTSPSTPVQTTAPTPAQSTSPTQVQTTAPAAQGSAQWVIPTVTAKAGEKVTMDVVVKNSAIEVAGAQFNIKQNTPIVFDSSVTGAAYATIVPNDTEQYFAFGEGAGKGVKAAEGATIIRLNFTVPAGTADGTYPVKWSNAFITDANGNKINDKITLVDGAIVIGDPGTTDPTTPAAEGSAEWVIPTVTAKAGDKVAMDVIVKNSAIEVAGAQFNIKQNTPIVFDSSVTGTAYATIVPNDTEQYFAFGEGAGKGVKAAEGATIIRLNFTVPAGTADGTYPVKWSNAFITDTNGNKITDKIKLTDGAIVIGDNTVVTDPTTTTPSTPVEGKAEWVIPTVEARPGDNVKMDVVVKNSAIEVAGAQFNIKQATPITYSSSASGNAYAEIVANDSEQYYAFGEGAGKGVKAAENATIITLNFTVPVGTADGTYPVEWSNAFITDTNGNKINDKITLTNGAIVVNNGVTTASTAPVTTSPETTPRPGTGIELPEGGIAWQAGTVTAHPGETVTVKVSIYDPNAAKLPVAGASFTVTNEGKIEATGVSDAKNGYDSSVVYNPTTKEFAFGQDAGKNVPSEDGKTVVEITYQVDPSCPEGEYLVDLGGLKVFNTNGEDITKFVVPVDGLIKVVGPPVDPITTAPADQTTAPADSTTAPADQTTAPADQTTAPADSTTAPADATTAPADSTTAPADQTTAPADSTTAPADSTTAPADQTTAPADSTTAPADQTTAPADSTTAPADQTTAPADSTTAPADQTTAPADSTTAPADSTTAPADQTTAPADSTTAPADQTTAPIDTTSPAPSVVTTLPKGSVTWQGQTVEGKPGQKVKVKFVIEDTNSELPVAGAQFTITSPIGNGTVEDGNTNGYGATVVGNPTNGEYAFSNAIGAGIKSEDGKTVIELEFTIPEDCAPGEYTVDIDKIKVFDTNGNDISDRVNGKDGKIVVLAPDITTAPADQTTAPADATTAPADVTTAPADVTTAPADVTTAPADVTTAPDDVTTAPADVTTAPADVTTAPADSTTAPADVTTAPADVTTAPADVTTAPADVTTAPDDVTTAPDDVTTAPADVTTAPDDVTTAPADSTTAPAEETTAPADVTTAPVDTTTAPTDVTTAPTDVTTGPADQTTEPIDTTTAPIDTTQAPGEETGTTSTKLTNKDGYEIVKTYYTISTVPGYYFSHDTGVRGQGEPGGFDKGQVTKLTLHMIDTRGVDEATDLSLANINYGGLTPNKAYHDRFDVNGIPTNTGDKSFGENFAYDIPVYYGEGENNQVLVGEDGNALTVKAYIGVKGDTDLNFVVDGRDSTATLTYYARISTINYDEETTAISPAEFISGADDPLDDLAAFLSDVDANEWSAENWKLAREERTLDGRDSTGIITYYARASATEGQYKDYDDQQLWYSVVPDRFGSK